MFKNYFKIALRNLRKHKANSFINIAGLVVGFSAFLVIFLVVQFEESYDAFHTNKKELYRIVRVGRNDQNREYRTGVPLPVTQSLRNDFPQLKNVAAVMGDYDAQVSTIASDGDAEKNFKEPYVLVAEPQFFNMFDFPLLAGNVQTALNDVNTLLLSEDAAKKYFGDWQTAMGKSLRLYGQAMKVTGILKNAPVNTDFPLNLVVSYATLLKHQNPNDWGSINDANYCFVQLAKGSSAQQFSKQLNSFTDVHIKPVNPGYYLSMQPLKEIHFDDRYGNLTGNVFTKNLILALSIIGIFLLVIACVNFINITTAQAINRAREVGVRKVLGGSRKQLIAQFLGETGITTLLALIASVVIAWLCIPMINNLMNIDLSFGNLVTLKFILLITTAFFSVTFLSGLYPSMILSGFKSINVLKSSVAAGGSGISLRKALVVFQFVIAQCLIIGTLIVASQMNYFHNADMGFDKDGVVNAPFPSDSLSRTKTDAVFNELKKMPGVQNVSFSAFAPSGGGNWATDLRKESNHSATKPDMIVSMKPADTSYFSLYQLKLVAGRPYFASDTAREWVVNETVANGLGFRDPAGAVGAIINVNGQMLPIAGVVKNFHTASLRDDIGAVVLAPMKRAYRLANIKIDMRNSPATIAAIKNLWSKYYPGYIFEYNFIDQSIANFYKQESQLSKLYKVFSIIAIFISCLGLYGLVSFMAIQRKKEIGIRKVLGAPVRDIVALLSKEFTLLVLLAFLIAAPVAGIYMSNWLQQYAYHIGIDVGFFALTIIGSLCIAWLTAGYTAIKAALANPVKSLRTE